MQKVFNKISPGVFSVLVIVAMLPPVASMMAFLPDVKRPSSHPMMAQIVAPEPVEYITYLVPKLSRDLFFSHLNRHWAGLFSFIDCFALFDKAQTCAEGHNYFYNNDVHFNIPSIAYRQPSSEHSFEG